MQDLDESIRKYVGECDCFRVVIFSPPPHPHPPVSVATGPPCMQEESPVVSLKVALSLSISASPPPPPPPPPRAPSTPPADTGRVHAERGSLEGTLDDQEDVHHLTSEGSYRDLPFYLTPSNKHGHPCIEITIIGPD